MNQRHVDCDSTQNVSTQNGIILEFYQVFGKTSGRLRVEGAWPHQAEQPQGRS